MRRCRDCIGRLQNLINFTIKILRPQQSSSTERLYQAQLFCATKNIAGIQRCANRIAISDLMAIFVLDKGLNSRELEKAVVKWLDCIVREIVLIAV